MPFKNRRENYEELYDSSFYSGQQDGSLQSAELVVPLVMEMLECKRVIDVGCGLGTWLRVFETLGAERVLGLDGAHVNTELLQISTEQFRAIDLANTFDIGETFDLAVSLEVAEHLPPASAPGFVESITKLAPVVLFSAAAPLQGGTHHVNEQWPDYWQRLFERHDYQMLDPIRKLIWKDGRIKWWYRQNTVLFVRRNVINANSRFREAAKDTNDLTLVSHAIIERHKALMSPRPTLMRLPGLLVNRISRWLRA
jgi:SAM-dependent methyltransferase